VPARVLQERRVRARHFAHTPPPAGQDSTGRSDEGAEGGSRRRDRSEELATESWRDVCRRSSLVAKEQEPPILDFPENDSSTLLFLGVDLLD